MLNIHEPEESKPDIKQWATENLQQLCVRNGNSKNQVMLEQFSKVATPI